MIVAVLAERSEAATAGDSESGGIGADQAAAERLLKKNRAALQRVPELRARRGRAYALLARNGFDPEVCREVSGRFATPDAGLDV